MKLQKIPFRSTHAFTEFFLKYIEQHAKLKPFYNRFPSLNSFKGQIKEKSSFPSSTRKVLVSALQNQYKSVKVLPVVENNIKKLGESTTFTVTTGHQLSIFTGPLYVIFKIVTVIKACRLLKKKYPKHHFVPVYWMASEDHDYEEIKSFRLYGKKYTWETGQQGAVGRFHLKDIKELLSQVPGEIGPFREAYTKAYNLAAAVRSYMNALFGADGLVVVDGDDADLKTLLVPVVEDDLFNHGPYREVTKTNHRLAELGFHPQVNPREINLFYLGENIRGRIERQGDQFNVVDTQLKFSRKEIESALKTDPTPFSPNVILRPVYQELILPNLAYVGGPAELVYWLELKGVFDHYKLPFPILLPRNFGMVVDAPTLRKMGRSQLPLKAFFESKNDLCEQWILKHSSHDLSLSKQAKAMEKILDEVKKRSAAIDPTLGPMTAAHAKRAAQMIQTIEKKMIRAEKRKQSDSIRQIEAIKDALFPNGGLQERNDNFLNFSQSDPKFVQELLHYFDPFDFQLHVLQYHDQEGTSKAVSRKKKRAK